MPITGDIASIGECMVELAPIEGGFYRRGFAGDTLNTAWYMRALLSPAARRIRYVSAVGTDGLSDSMVEFLAANALDTRSVARLHDRTVGLYLITLAGAERSFTYWRSMSAARLLAADPGRLAAALDGVGLVYLSGITLAILEPDDRSRLFVALEALRQRGGEVAFDPNIRPKLWSDRATMAAVITEGYRVATIALPTFPDDAELYGDESPAVTASRIAALGVGEIVVKNGAAPALVRFGQQEFMVPAVEAQPVDTTGAGDSFNGGYLAARIACREPSEAAALGHAVAARVICLRGALADMELFADLRVG